MKCTDSGSVVQPVATVCINSACVWHNNELCVAHLHIQMYICTCTCVLTCIYVFTCICIVLHMEKK